MWMELAQASAVAVVYLNLVHDPIVDETASANEANAGGMKVFLEDETINNHNVRTSKFDSNSHESLESYGAKWCLIVSALTWRKIDWFQVEASQRIWVDDRKLVTVIKLGYDVPELPL
ncbi:hypothetical protein VM1G_11643 [Cytospora mali]|uniref:Uncharacterized protein n=1 Tax=Cytospora mali TaxID=578113 RepID=A0A194VZS2_CYTMA|nr:hypothetical protein VM1G_11643 [Valsa mali]